MTSYNPFYDDVKSRKSEASGARHRVGGSKSKKCSLPSDNLTDAQKRKLNGPVRAYNVKAPMSWDAFKKMPHDLQQAHVAFLQETFNVSFNDLAGAYFGVTGAALRLYAKNHSLEYSSYRGRRLDSADAARFADWLGMGDSVPAEEAAPATCDVIVNGIGANIAGAADDLLRYIGEMLGGRSADVHIEITFKEEN